MTSLTDGFLQLGIKQVQLFKDDPETFLELLITAPSQRSVLFSVYNTLRSSGRITPMEDLPEEFKKDIWQEAKDRAKGRLPVDKLILLSKCLYVLNWLLENQ